MSYQSGAWARLAAVCCLTAAGCGCSIKHIAINKMGNALASSGSTFEGDDDPELVAAAIPFGLKLYESLLAESPKHPGLLLAACTGFTEYAYAFVDLKAEEAKDENAWTKPTPCASAARRLYLRALTDTACAGLESPLSRFRPPSSMSNAATALKRVRKPDVRAALLDGSFSWVWRCPIQDQSRDDRATAPGGNDRPARR